MAWIKSHQVLSYFLFSLVAFFLFFLLGPSSSCSAASFDFTPTPDTIYSITDLGLDFTPHFIKYTVSSSNFSFYHFYIETSDNQTSNNPFNSNFDNTIFSHNYSPFGNSATSYSGVITIPYYPNLTPVFRFRRINSSITYNVTFTFLDTLDCPDCDCPDCPDCPEVPDTPYGDKLDKIYHAILIGSATMLVIYFFFIMFKWYLGGQ